MKRNWQVQVHGEAGDKSFEISVVNINQIFSAQKHYGWFDDNKLLIGHNGGPCNWPVIPEVWDGLIQLAQSIANRLNARESRAAAEAARKFAKEVDNRLPSATMPA